MSEALPELFARALELDAPGREALLRELSSRAPVLAAELAEMLASGEEATSPLDRALWRPPGDEESPVRPLPDRIGSYRILRELGRGGMGRVYLAEEEAEAFRRTVALKVIDRPAFDDDALRRFREELRILSSLEHPGIARFLNGGRSPEGVWFLALEFIDGEDLLAWTRDHGLSVRKRIELFLAALDAVRFAHARGVVHRDLKPGHILVDAEGRPHLLDFGISKLVDPETRASLAETRTEARALTPAYASPEQFRGEPVTPASDIYSLGAILYELLAGRRPFAAVKGSAAALERAVLETDPEPPSTAARRASEGDPPPEGRVPRALPRGESWRDLDAICLKSLRKSPAERYADASELAGDLERYLDGRPVEARRGGRRYRAARFLARHRAPIAITGALGVAAVALFYAFAVARPAGRTPAPAPFSFHAAERTPLADLEAAFAREPGDVEAGAALAIALAANGREPEARLLVARMRQIPTAIESPLVDYVEATLAMSAGEPQRALVLFTRAQESAVRQGRGDLVGQIRASRGRLLSTMGERAEAAAEMRTARAEIERAGDDDSLWRVLNDLAIEKLQAGEMEAGRELLEEAVVTAERAGSFAQVARANLGLVTLQLGRPDSAEAVLRENVAWLRERGDVRRLGEALEFLAEALHDLGRTEEAATLLVESIARLEAADADSILAISLALQAEIAWQGARLSELEAIAARMESVALRTGDPRGSSFAEFDRARLAVARGDRAAASAHFDVARRLLVDNGDVDMAATQDLAHARIAMYAGELDAATDLLDGAFARLAPGAAALGSAFSAEMLRARIDLRRGDPGAARRRLEKAGTGSASSPSITRRIDYLVARAELAAATGHGAEAEADFRSALAAATSASRRLDEIEIRIARARLGSVAPDSREDLAAIASEADALGLAFLADLARTGWWPMSAHPAV